jgi:hypothetical protein
MRFSARCSAVCLLVMSSAVWADSWAPPSKEIYTSADKQARLTVMPRDLKSSLAYFEDKVEGREPAGAPAGTKTTTARALLELRNASGQWERVWTGSLANEVAPVEAVVANKGQAFATFDNWHSMGFGPDAIVIYGREGILIRKLGLMDLFPDWYVASLPGSVSSIHWRGEPRISSDGAELIVPVVQPAKDASMSDEATTLDLAIRMADGAPVGLDRPEWKQAMQAAAATARQNCKDQQDEVAEWNAPITAPATAKEQDWHHFLRETQFRTKWSVRSNGSDDPPYPGTTVVRPPSATDFQASVTWLEEALTEKAVIEHDLRAIGSPDIARLTVEIERIAPTLSPGGLKDVDQVVVADAAHAGRIRTALSKSGANLEIINPKQSFPQIKERIRDAADLLVCHVPAA